MDQFIAGWGRGSGSERGNGPRAEEGVASSTQLPFGGHKVRGITVCPEDFVAGMKMDDSIWMGGTIVEQVSEGLHGGLGAIGLLSGESTKGHQHSQINGTCIVEEGTNDLLNVFVVSSIMCSCVVRLWGVLDFGAIGGSLASM